MTIILVYDLKSNTQKMNKLCKQYLNWVQESVFEGELTESKYKKLVTSIKKIKEDDDSILIYKIKSSIFVNKEIIGVEKNNLSNFI